MKDVHSYTDCGREFFVRVIEPSDGGYLIGHASLAIDKARTTVDPRNFADALLRELARLATQKPENLPDGSREFAWHWPYKIQLNPPRLFLRDGDGWSPCDAADRVVAPPLEVLAEQFAALGREQGRAEAMREKVNILPGAKAIIEQKDARIAELEQTERDSRAEVASLIEAMDQQKARAETFKADRDTWRSHAEHHDARAGAAEERLAVLEGELVAAKTAAAGRARTEGDPRRFVSFVSVDRLWSAVAADGTAWERQPGDAWAQVPPLPAIEPAKSGAEECEPDPLGTVRHDWRKIKPGLIACERCGKPFRAGIENEACGAQP